MNSPNLTTVLLPPATRRSIGDDSRRPASRSMPRRPGTASKLGKIRGPQMGRIHRPLRRLGPSRHRKGVLGACFLGTYAKHSAFPRVELRSKDGEGRYVALEASFQSEASEQSPSRTGIGCRRFVVVAGRRRLGSDQRGRGGDADAEHCLESPDHSRRGGNLRRQPCNILCLRQGKRRNIWSERSAGRTRMQRVRTRLWTRVCCQRVWTRMWTRLQRLQSRLQRLWRLWRLWRLRRRRLLYLDWRVPDLLENATKRSRFRTKEHCPRA